MTTMVPARWMAWVRSHKALCAAIVAAMVLSPLPWVQGWLVTGDAWQGMPQSYADEFIYYAHMREIATGNFFFGNPYFLEHRFTIPLALFGSSILAAVPLFFGLPLMPALIINFLVWGPIFVCIAYALLRRLGITKMQSALVSFLAFVQAFDILWRASSQQQVLPFLLLFYLALALFLKEPGRVSRIAALGVTAGVTFYLYGFLWQSIVATLGLVVIFAAVMRDWSLAKRGLIASAIGGVIGLPPFLYTVWVTGQPYFWESMDRWGLVHTHLPVAEVVYSGAWVGVALIVLGALIAGVRSVREDETIRRTTIFLASTGMALWIIQGSNLITGKLLELGEHLQRFIVLWLALATMVIGALIWKHRSAMAKPLKRFLVLGLAVLIVVNLYFTYAAVRRFAPFPGREDLWTTEQHYAKALAWLDANEAEPVVIWSDPHEDLPTYVTALTKHYVLYQQFGYFNLMSNEEFFERYLVSQYFDQPTVESLKADLITYGGRSANFHHPKTIERGIKLCRILRAVVPGPDCGVPPTAQELLGDEFFENLSKKFNEEIEPNMSAYLEKYHVAYIVKDTLRDPVYEPERLGATLVFEDERFQVYRVGAASND